MLMAGHNAARHSCKAGGLQRRRALKSYIARSFHHITGTVFSTILGQENGDGCYTVTAMKETLDRSNLGLLNVGDKVNVERSMEMNGRLDGHIVQGHVDMTAECVDMRDADGSTYFTFKYAFDKEMARRGYFTVDKGSVTVNGVSLTVCEPTDDTFTVAIIPYTFEHTNFHDIKVGSRVNIEFDILGKYIARLSHFN